jgi:RecB family endonuclease NucS
MESEWMPIAILGGTGAVFFLAQRFSGKSVAAVLGIIFLIRIAYILHSSIAFTERLDWLNKMASMMDRKGINKMVVIKRDNTLDEKLQVDWSVPYEMMLLTSGGKGKTTKILNYFDESQIDHLRAREETRCMIGPWGYHCPEQLNRVYFNPDSTSNYVVLSLNQLEKQ